jgi:hypothetical protein
MQVRQSGTTVEAVQKECVELISLTTSKISYKFLIMDLIVKLLDEVYSLDYPDNYTYRMKVQIFATKFQRKFKK